MFKTIAIGDKFVYHNKTLVVVASKNDSCRCCFFSKGDCTKDVEVVGACSAEGRSDNNSVIFKVWKEE